MPSTPTLARNTFELRPADRLLLERWVRTPTAAQRLVWRSRIILLLGDGHSGREVGARLGLSRHTVDLWRQRFRQGGCAVLLRDRPGRGRKHVTPATAARAPRT